MQKNQLLKNENNEVVRLLAFEGDEVLYISCSKEKKGMPKWEVSSAFSDFQPCSEEELQKLWGIELTNEGELEAGEKKITRDRYAALIAPVLTFLEDDRLRTEAIARVAEQNHITKQTVRNYLKKYLIFNSVSALARKKRVDKEKPISVHEKNIRWAINKYYYSRKKNSLNFAYKMMLAKKYTDEEGRLMEHYPSFNQFRYWYSKNKKMLTYYISRDGMSDFMRNNRVLFGDVQAYASAPGLGMADSTVLDLYVVSDDRTQVIGRPVLSVIVDAYSYLCLGYSLGWEAGEFLLRDLMCNVIADKKEHCRKFGIEISENDWPNDKLPGIIITDRGADYAGYTYSQLAELSVQIQNLEGYRADKKGPVEKFFDVIQNYFGSSSECVE